MCERKCVCEGVSVCVCVSGGGARVPFPTIGVFCMITMCYKCTSNSQFLKSKVTYFM